MSMWEQGIDDFLGWYGQKQDEEEREAEKLRIYKEEQE